MSKKDRLFCLFICAAFGLAGGTASSLALWKVTATNAQLKSEVLFDRVRAQSFEVVDAQGKLLARLGQTGSNGELRLYELTSKSRSGLNNRAMIFHDEADERRIWLGMFPTDPKRGPTYPALKLWDEKKTVKNEFK